ncbi:MAG: hypothetical protein KatS3mg105_0944 [Gemmatales bacterium]|nr:MAG: hypothetical protein KatS3mg105_0944 [Gemmatales bacterium]
MPVPVKSANAARQMTEGVEVAQAPAKAKGTSVTAKNADAASDANGFASLVQPFLKAHCTRCHGVRKQEGNLSLHDIDSNLIDGKDIKRWVRVAEKLDVREMPPEDQPQPDAVQTTRVLRWILRELEKGGDTCGSTIAPARLWQSRQPRCLV